MVVVWQWGEIGDVVGAIEGVEDGGEGWWFRRERDVVGGVGEGGGAIGRWVARVGVAAGRDEKGGGEVRFWERESGGTRAAGVGKEEEEGG